MTAPLFSQAMAAHQAGKMDEAEKLYRAFLETQPHHPDAQALLGSVLSAKGHHDEALALIQQALKIDPNAGLFHFYYGNALMEAGRLTESIKAFDKAVQLAPAMPDAPYNLGNALRLSQQPDQAKAAYAMALQRDPHHIMARNNLALLLGDGGDPALAVGHLTVVVQQAPGFLDGWLNLCNFAEKAGLFDLAFQAGRQATALAPDSAQAWLGLGVALNRLTRHDLAVEAYKTALHLHPTRADLWDNLGQTYQFQNKLAEAEDAYRHCLASEGQTLDDAFVLTCDEKALGRRHWHLALLELLKGDLLHGFARYRARFADVGGLTRPSFSAQLWRGEDLAGRTILVSDEQGMGDALMMARFLPILRQAGARVLFRIQKPLVPFFQGWGGVDCVLSYDDPLPPFDFYASIFDLPFGLHLTLQTLSGKPYLPTPALDQQHALPITRPKRIGFAWAGAPLHKHDKKRSLPLALFAPLFQIDTAHFYALCKDKRPGDDDLLATFSNVTDLAGRLSDFRDTAQFVAQMDLMITCDTSLAHLAGGMGKKVWLLLPFAPDWRWLLDRADSPWYDKMMLFRQTKEGEWNPLIDNVKNRLL